MDRWRLLADAESARSADRALTPTRNFGAGGAPAPAAEGRTDRPMGCAAGEGEDDPVRRWGGDGSVGGPRAWATRRVVWPCESSAETPRATGTRASPPPPPPPPGPPTGRGLCIARPPAPPRPGPCTRPCGLCRVAAPTAPPAAGPSAEARLSSAGARPSPAGARFTLSASVSGPRPSPSRASPGSAPARPAAGPVSPSAASSAATAGPPSPPCRAAADGGRMRWGGAGGPGESMSTDDESATSAAASETSIPAIAAIGMGVTVGCGVRGCGTCGPSAPSAQGALWKRGSGVAATRAPPRTARALLRAAGWPDVGCRPAAGWEATEYGEWECVAAAGGEATCWW